MLIQFIRQAGVVLCALAVAQFAHAGAYTFTKIADTADGYSNFSLPAINQNGVIAFNATLGGTRKIFTSTGGPAALAYDPLADGITNINGEPAINNAGHIAFIGNSPGTSDAVHLSVYLWPGAGAPNLIFDARTASGLQTKDVSVALTPTSDAVTYGYMDDSQAHIVSPYGTAPLGAHYQLGRVSVSTNGGAIWTWAGHNTGPLNYDAVAITYSGPPRQDITNIPNTYPPGSPASNVQFNTVGAPIAVNATGTIILTAQYYGTNIAGLQNGAFAFYDDGRSVFLDYGMGQPVAVNDGDTVLEGSKVFSGSSVDTFLNVGDPFMGSTVQSINYMPAGFNNGNELAFEATLADGRQGIYTVSVPEPTAMVFLGIAGLSVLSRRRRK